MNYFDLTPTLPLFKQGINVAELIKDEQTYNYINLDFTSILSNELTQFFALKNVHPFMVELFYLRPYSSSQPHIDIEKGNAVKINWVFAGEDSTMNWFSETDHAVPKVVSSPANTNVVFYEQRHLKLVDRYKLRGPTVVQTGIPHNVTAYQQGRYCVNVSITEDITAPSRPTMERAREIFAGHFAE